MKKNTQERINYLAKKYKDKKVFLYGTGKFFDEIADNYDLTGLNVVGICDKTMEHGEIYKGFKIFALEKMIFEKPDIVIFTVVNSKPIIKFLKEDIFPYCEEFKYTDF